MPRRDVRPDNDYGVKLVIDVNESTSSLHLELLHNEVKGAWVRYGETGWKKLWQFWSRCWKRRLAYSYITL